MNSWFEGDRLANLQAVAASWIGTPFFPHGNRKGKDGGVSCQTFVGCLYREVGLLSPSWEIPSGALSTGFEPMIQTISEALVDLFVATERPVLPGDLICYKRGRAGHLGVAVNEMQFIHCLDRIGVQYSRLDDAIWMRIIAKIWRPIKPML